MPGWVGSLMNTLEAFLLLGAPMLKIFLSRGKPQAQLSGWGGFAKPPSKTLHGCLVGRLSPGCGAQTRRGSPIGPLAVGVDAFGGRTPHLTKTRQEMMCAAELAVFPVFPSLFRE